MNGINFKDKFAKIFLIIKSKCRNLFYIGTLFLNMNRKEINYDFEKEEINDLIEFILENDKERNINFLKNQTIDELEDIKDNIINR